MINDDPSQVISLHLDVFYVLGLYLGAVRNELAQGIQAIQSLGALIIKELKKFSSGFFFFHHMHESFDIILSYIVLGSCGK